MDDVKESDNLISIDDDIEGHTEDNRSLAGIADISGKIAHVKYETKGGGCSTPKVDEDDMELVSMHEFLHNMGLPDMYTKPKSEQEQGNYMMDDRGSHLSNFDKVQALNAIHNRGTNFSNKSQIESSNWFQTSNLDPYRKSTAGSTGKVPKIVKSSN